MKSLTLRRSLFIILLSLSNICIADEPVQSSGTVQPKKPTWELGVGLGALSLPHYRGSDQRSNYVAPIPYLRYHGKRLRVDKEGGRFFFYNDDDINIDVSTAFAFPVDSDDNRAREGMTDLDPIIELGPRVEFKLYKSDDENIRFRFALPLRAAFATDLSHTESVGWVFSPYVQLRYFNSGWETAVSLGPVWASEEYHDYFYEVAPQYATATRPVYDAQSGYSGSRITLTLSKRFDKLWFGLFAKYDNLNSATFINSPLIKQNDSLMVGAALSWVFKKSN